MSARNGPTPQSNDLSRTDKARQGSTQPRPTMRSRRRKARTRSRSRSATGRRRRVRIRPTRSSTWSSSAQGAEVRSPSAATASRRTRLPCVGADVVVSAFEAGACSSLPCSCRSGCPSPQSFTFQPSATSTNGAPASVFIMSGSTTFRVDLLMRPTFTPCSCRRMTASSARYTVSPIDTT
jgi:hypothetical protein